MRRKQAAVRRRPRRKAGSEHHDSGHERWLVTYADMITLLMVLFIVMFSMSAVDQQKFMELARGLAAGFGVTTGFSGPVPLSEGGKTPTVLPLDSGADPGLRAQVSDSMAGAVQEAVSAADRARASDAAAAAVREVANLREVQLQIEAALREAGLQESVRFSFDERGLVITVVTSEVVFEGDRADLLPVGRKILDPISVPMRRLPNSVQVDGHTNQLPVPTLNYPSAWELSTARASTVVRYLADQGVPAERLAAAGYAGTRPLVAPEDPRSVTMNRRVDIVILSTLPPEQRALLPSVAG